MVIQSHTTPIKNIITKDLIVRTAKKQYSIIPNIVILSLTLFVILILLAANGVELTLMLPPFLISIGIIGYFSWNLVYKIGIIDDVCDNNFIIYEYVIIRKYIDKHVYSHSKSKRVETQYVFQLENFETVKVDKLTYHTANTNDVAYVVYSDDDYIGIWLKKSNELDSFLTNYVNHDFAN